MSQEEILKTVKTNLADAMEKIGQSLSYQLSRVRTGRAQASVLDGVKVDYYGVPTPVSQAGQLSTPEARLLQVRPFDKSMIAAIEKAIMGANLGLTPSNDGNLIRIPFPALTEERRKERVKEVKKIGEEAKISLRNARREQNEIVKKAEKNKEISEDDVKKLQDEVQKLIDSYVKKIDDMINAKETELMTV